MHTELEIIKNTLESFGYSGKEALVYATLLETGQSSVYSLARKSGVKPSTTYTILDSLLLKGAINRVPRNKKDQFCAKPLDQLLYTLKSKIIGLEKVSERRKEKMDNAKITFYEGIESLRGCLLDKENFIKGSESVGFYGTTEFISKDLNEIFLEMNQKRMQLGLKVRAIVPDSERMAEWRAMDNVHNRTVKIFPESKYHSNISMDILKDKIILVDFRKEKAISIKDESITDTFKQIFELAWNSPGSVN